VFEKLERVKGIEPLSKAWEAFVLPLNYTRTTPALRTVPANLPEVSLTFQNIFRILNSLVYSFRAVLQGQQVIY